MTDLPTPATPPAGAMTPHSQSPDLLALFLSGRNANTLRNYEGDLRDFAAFISQPGPGPAIEMLLAMGQGMANACAVTYKAHMLAKRLSSSTVARRLAALRSAVRLARQIGRVSWSLEVESPKVETYRDTRGPGDDGWKAIRSAAEELATDWRGSRNLAIVRLLHDLALRRAEVHGLDLEHVDLDGGGLMVLRKGKRERIRLTLPPSTRAVVADWIRIRGDVAGPLFPACPTCGRLTGKTVERIVGKLGVKARLSRPARPHGLRHQAITEALDKTGGDVRAVRKFSGHAKLDTLVIYDDARQDLAGDVARRVAGD